MKNHSLALITVYFCLTLVIVAAILVSSCSSPAPVTTPAFSPTSSPGQTTAVNKTTPTSTSVPSPAQVAAKPIELRFAYHAGPIQKVAVNGLEVWAKNVEKAAGGKLKLTTYPGETLCLGKDTYEAVKNGVTDIGWAYMGFFPGRFPLNEFNFLPCLSRNANAQGATRVVMDIYNKYPQLKTEFADVKLLHFNSQDPCFIATGKKPISTLEDMKGLKLRITGSYVTDFTKNVGAVPMLISSDGVYEAMQKGVIDGYGWNWEGFTGRRMYEQTKYITLANWYLGSFFTIMNLSKWNSLPPEIQKAMESASGVEAGCLIAKTMDDEEAPARAKCKEKGIQIIDLSPAEIAKWHEAAKPSLEKWISDVKAKGAPAQEIINDTLQLYEKYSVK
jgi:TRAP-type C4-dicarboxylate transport system substrate-binding protein